MGFLRIEKVHDEETGKEKRGCCSLFFFIFRMSVTITLSFILLSTISYFVIRQFVVVAEVQVPNVVGLTLEDALKDMTEERFTLVFEKYEYSKVLSEGRIISQYPKGGALAKKGSPVRVTISQGSPLVNVPDIRGETRIGAGIKLRAADLKMGALSRKYDSRIKKDTVIAQDPPPGSGAPLQHEIKLLISLGPAPRKYLMPAFHDATINEATMEIEGAGLEISEILKENSPLRRNRVIFQRPRPGVLVSPGDKISLRISTGVSN